MASKSAVIADRLPGGRNAALAGGAAMIGAAAAVAVTRGLSKLADSEQQAAATDAGALPESAPRRPTARPAAQTQTPDFPTVQSPAMGTSAPSTPARSTITRNRATPSQPPTVELVPQAFDMNVMGRDGAPTMMRLEDAFMVTKAGEETGLAVVREPAGSWNVAHVETGMSLAGDMDSVYEAEGLAALLAHEIDWNQPFDEMPQAELQDAGRIIGKYQAQMKGIKNQLGL